MPPVDYCPSCEGKKAESQALDIAKATAQRVDQEADLQAAENSPSPGATGTGFETSSLSGITTPLLSPTLAVQATLNLSSAETGDNAPPNASSRRSGDAAALRLQAAEAYRG